MLLPDLRGKGFHATPDILFADFDLIDEDEKATDQSRPEPENWTAEGKGGRIMMEAIGDPTTKILQLHGTKRRQLSQQWLDCMLLRGRTRNF